MVKNIKSGFTLAEVLVALGVAGVIVAMTIPSLNMNAQKKQLAVSLGRNVQTVETGCNKLIQFASARSSNGDFLGHYMIHKNLSGQSIGNTATDTISGSNLWTTGTEQFFDTRALSNTDISNYKSAVKAYGGGTASPTPDNLFGTDLVVNTKTGAYYGAGSEDESMVTYADPIVGDIYIDVNGMDSPNQYGKDIFLFGLTDACKMIPAGSERVNSLRNIPVESSGCSGNSVTNGLSCTSRVVKEGYNISY